MSAPRRTIDEIQLIFERHPELSLVFVEGPSDKAMLIWFFSRVAEESPLEQARPEPWVYDIDEIEVPNTLLESMGLESGSRSRVVALASSLEEPSQETPPATCIIDRDLDAAIGTSHSFNTLLLTDYCSMECYACNRQSFNDFTRQYAQNTNLKIAKTLSDIVDVCNQLFAVRVARHKEDIRCSWPHPKSSLRLEGGRVRLDIDHFLNRLLSSGSAHGQKERLRKATVDAQGDFNGDHRLYVHGKDLIAVIAWYFRKQTGNNRQFHEDAVGRAIFLSINFEQISKKVLFLELVNRTR